MNKFIYYISIDICLIFALTKTYTMHITQPESLFALNAAEFEERYSTLSKDEEKHLIQLITQEIKTNKLSLELIPRENTAYRKIQFLLYYQHTQEAWLTQCFSNPDLLADYILPNIKEQEEYLPYSYNHKLLSPQSTRVFKNIKDNIVTTLKGYPELNTCFKKNLCPIAQNLTILLYSAKQKSLNMKEKNNQLWKQKLHKTESKAQAYAPYFAFTISNIFFSYSSLESKYPSLYSLCYKAKRKTRTDKKYYSNNINLFRRIVDEERSHEH